MAVSSPTTPGTKLIIPSFMEPIGSLKMPINDTATAVVEKLFTDKIGSIPVNVCCSPGLLNKACEYIKKTLLKGLKTSLSVPLFYSQEYKPIYEYIFQDLINARNFLISLNPSDISEINKVQALFKKIAETVSQEMSIARFKLEKNAQDKQRLYECYNESRRKQASSSFGKQKESQELPPYDAVIAALNKLSQKIFQPIGANPEETSKENQAPEEKARFAVVFSPRL